MCFLLWVASSADHAGSNRGRKIRCRKILGKAERTVTLQKTLEHMHLSLIDARPSSARPTCSGRGSKFLAVVIVTAAQSAFTADDVIQTTPANRQTADQILRLASKSIGRSLWRQDDDETLSGLKIEIGRSAFRNLESTRRFITSIHGVSAYLTANTENTTVLENSRTASNNSQTDINVLITPGLLKGELGKLMESSTGKRQFNSFDRRPKAGFNAEELTRKLDAAYQAYCALLADLSKRGFTLLFDKELCDQVWTWQWETMATTMIFCFQKDGTFETWMTPEWDRVYKAKGSWKFEGNLLTAKMERAWQEGSIFESEFSYPFVIFEKRAVRFCSPEVVIFEGNKDYRMDSREK